MTSKRPTTADAYERAARVVWWLAQGEELTTAQVAEKIGTHRSTAWRMLSTISRVCPIYLYKGFWRKLS